MSIIALCGFMGAGKTTVGKNLARYLGYKFIDLDWYLEEKFGCSVAEFFSINGEAMFRAKELDALKEIILSYEKEDSKGLILALGGGALTNEYSSEIIKSHTTCIYLNCSNSLLIKRLAKSETERPLLAGKTSLELEKFIEQKKTEREDAYIISSKIIIDIKEEDKILNIIEKIFDRLSGL